MLTYLLKANRWLFILYGTFYIAFTAFAQDKGLIDSLTGIKINETAFMRALGANFGGWVEIGFTGNPQNPANDSNAPVAFNDGANQFKLHQVYGFIENKADTGGKNWDIGFRADLLYGNDAHFTSTINFDTNVLDDQLVFPQGYADIYAPIGNGITVNIGHFYTIIGYESVPSTNNFFLSHAYTMLYGEPFTRTGILFSYPLNENFTAIGSIATGWDTFLRQPINYSGKIFYATNDKKTSASVAFVTGDVKTNNLDNDHNRTLYSIVMEHDITSRLHYVLQHDLGFEEKIITGHSAHWYGVNQYLFYQFSNHLSAGLRAEWFSDQDGVRVIGNRKKENFIDIALGLNYQLTPGLTMRPEIRYDHATENKVFNDNKSDDQILLSLSAILSF
ncbi:porin [Nitrosococcus wardiae]|uniref:Porin n=1 Tax=Nitrosococcus wardiae TaxID=1814290 RepID=A0A4P7BWI5_9GAMM|nr:porin [Nitrosococcus wardiae]QBQ54311.1 porin [Nitrosococcus wardiae]